MARLRWLQKSVQDLVGGVSQQGAWLVSQVVTGLVVGRSVVLCSIARAVTTGASNTKRRFKAVLQRVDCGLGNPRAHVDRVWHQYMKRAGRFTSRSYDVVACDLSEIVKRFGKKMDHLCTVRDASESRKDKVVLEKGWWTVEIVATTACHHVLPLLRRLWSSVHPDFLSQNHEIIQGIKEVLPYVSRRAVWVMDRGFDAARTLWPAFSRLGLNWVVRLRGDRHVWLPGHDEPMTEKHLASLMDKPHVARPLVSRNNMLEKVEVRYGCCVVELVPGGDRYTLIAAKFADSDGMVNLMARRALRRADQGHRYVMAYFRRWQVEEEIRFDKQMWDIEDVRVRRWEKLCDLMTLTVIASGVLALRLAESPQGGRWLIKQAPIVDPIPPFPMYRLLMAVRAMLVRVAPALAL